MKIIFSMGSDLMIVKVKGKEISFSNQLTNFQKFIPIIPFIKRVHGAEKAMEFEEYLKKELTEEDMKDYVIKEFGKQGFIFKGVKDE